MRGGDVAPRLVEEKRHEVFDDARRWLLLHHRHVVEGSGAVGFWRRPIPRALLGNREDTCKERDYQVVLASPVVPRLF